MAIAVDFSGLSPETVDMEPRPVPLEERVPSTPSQAYLNFLPIYMCVCVCVHACVLQHTEKFNIIARHLDEFRAQELF